MQDLENSIQILKFCEKELTKVVLGGVVGAIIIVILVNKSDLWWLMLCFIMQSYDNIVKVKTDTF